VSGEPTWLDATPAQDGGVRYHVTHEGVLEYNSGWAPHSPQGPQLGGFIGDDVVVTFAAKLEDGTVIGEPASQTFRVGHGNVIRGMELLVQKMTLNMSVTAVIRADYGYGDNPPKNIGKNQTLIVDMKLNLFQIGQSMVINHETAETDKKWTADEVINATTLPMCWFGAMAERGNSPRAFTCRQAGFGQGSEGVGQQKKAHAESYAFSEYQGELHVAADKHGCEDIGHCFGKAAVVQRGVCPFYQKYLAAIRAKCNMLIVVDSPEEEAKALAAGKQPVPVGLARLKPGDPPDPLETKFPIPAVSILSSGGAALLKQLKEVRNSPDERTREAS
jgi:hypothetical protein